jgi:hypothetical protein
VAGWRNYIALGLITHVSCDHTALLARLRRLDPAVRAAVVADCWAAAGYVVERDATTVRVCRSGDERRLSVVDDPAADRVLDAAAVREALLYRVDRADANRIAERHLGAPLDEIEPPLGRRAASAARAWAVPAALGLAVVLVGVAGGLVGGDVEPGDQPAAVTTTPAVSTPSSVVATESPVSTRNVTAPGLGPNGVTDLAALAEAHERARMDAYAVVVGFERGNERVVRNIDIHVDGSRYRAEVRVERDGRVTDRATVYGEGSQRYALIADNGTTTQTLGPTDPGPAGVAPDDLGAAGVRLWFATPETRITGVVENDGQTGYRVVGTGVPPRSPASVDSYRFQALVMSNGLVDHLRVEFELTGVDNGSRRFEWRYGTRSPTVTRPDWITNVSNTTATLRFGR